MFSGVFRIKKIRMLIFTENTSIKCSKIGEVSLKHGMIIELENLGD